MTSLGFERKDVKMMTVLFNAWHNLILTHFLQIYIPFASHDMILEDPVLCPLWWDWLLKEFYLSNIMCSRYFSFLLRCCNCGLLGFI
jgi:hypothetical protein